MPATDLPLGRPPTERFVRGPRWLSRRAALPISLALIGVIGFGDRVTGIELPFTLLYLLPIGLGAWFRGRRCGGALSVVATASVGLSLVHDRMSSFALGWNAIGAAALFVAASWAVDRFRVQMDHERALRRMAVDQLRHAERLHVIGTLAAGVAHEIGTPLNVIAGCAEVLAEGSPDPQLHRRTDMILAQVGKVSAIIRRLLDFGRRGGAGRTHLDLAAIARTACEMLDSTARNRGSAIELASTGAVHVEGNASELEQVISNLILNAIQATERGTIRVHVSADRETGPRLARVDVEDEGCGIAAEVLPRIFDPFFTTKGVGEGTGLGLSVSYGIVRDHDGSIHVESEPRRGSRFTVLLPLRD